MPKLRGRLLECECNGRLIRIESARKTYLRNLRCDWENRWGRSTRPSAAWTYRASHRPRCQQGLRSRTTGLRDCRGATDAQWLAAAKARDTEQAASFWSDDATILMPNSPPITVKEAIRAYVTESFKSPDFSIAWTTDKVVVAASGDMAYATGTDHIIFRAGKHVVSTNNNGLVVWKKQRDGLWKAVADIATPAAPTVLPKK